MESNDAFELVPSDASWASALLFETTVEIYARVHRALRPRSAVPQITVAFEAFANADSFIRLEDGTLRVRISDLLENAPAPIHESLAHILLGKLYRKTIPTAYLRRYRLFLNRRDMRRQAQMLKKERGRKLLLPPQGEYHDLVEVFETLNREQFGGMMARPELGWSRLRSRTRLGHFDPCHNAIMISRIFDQPQVPRLALEYVMFHEMLHLEFPVRHSGTRRCIHTPEFKKAEKRFPQLEAAKKALKEL